MGISMGKVQQIQVWATIPDLSLKQEKDWEPWIEWLEANRGDLGPVLSWTNDGRDAVLVVMTMADSSSQAVSIAAEACEAAFKAMRNRESHPGGFQVSPPGLVAVG